MLSRSASLLVGIALAGSLAAQGSPVVIAAPPSLLDSLSLTEATVQDLTLPLASHQAIQVRINLGGAERTLTVAPHDIRAPNFRLLVEDQVGIHEETPPPSTTFRGKVHGDPDSAVGVSLIDGQLTGVVVIADTTWGIQPATDAFPSLPRTAHVVYRAADIKELPFVCGVDHGAGALSDPVTSAGPGGAASIAQIALDLSYRYYTINGSSVTNAQNAATATMNGVDTIYIRDVGIDYTITQIIVRTVNELYTSNNASTVLNQFRSRWNTFHGGVQRDVAHLLTGSPASGVLGIAWLSTICNRSLAYGVAWYYGNSTTRIAITAHELGHGWSAGHCSGSGCRIMCAYIGGCSGIITSFGTTEKNQIIAFRNTRTCLN